MCEVVRCSSSVVRRDCRARSCGTERDETFTVACLLVCVASGEIYRRLGWCYRIEGLNCVLAPGGAPSLDAGALILPGGGGFVSGVEDFLCTGG